MALSIVATSRGSIPPTDATVATCAPFRTMVPTFVASCSDSAATKERPVARSSTFCRNGQNLRRKGESDSRNRSTGCHKLRRPREAGMREDLTGSRGCYKGFSHGGEGGAAGGAGVEFVATFLARATRRHAWQGCPGPFVTKPRPPATQGRAYQTGERFPVSRRLSLARILAERKARGKSREVGKKSLRHVPGLSAERGRPLRNSPGRH
jgi:hypothetical protein